MTITATLDPLSPIEIRARIMKIVTGKISLTGTYATGGFSVASIDPRLRYLVVQGGAYQWHFNPDTQKVLAMKGVDAITMETADGTLVEETADVAITATLYYIGFVAEL
ncbi:MAG: hypothetical protein ACREOP_01540 [Thermodesulfobacteriota bacterium]